MAKATELREHILVSNGLTPMPEKTPLNAHIFGRIEREDYTVEKVYFEAYPGFSRPETSTVRKGGKDRFRGLSVRTDIGVEDDWRTAKPRSVPGRCINFAKQGYVIFSYDMVGRCDSGSRLITLTAGNAKHSGA